MADPSYEDPAIGPLAVDNRYGSLRAGTDGGMTVTEPITDRRLGHRWTVDDLTQIEDETHRYELIDGSLLVSPHARERHFWVAMGIRDILLRHAPALFAVGQDGGVGKDVWNYLVPDVVVIRRPEYRHDRPNLPPSDVVLAVEILSPSNRRKDLVVKRKAYAAAGIGRYWLVDPNAETVTVLALGEDGSYDTEIVVEAGKTWTTDTPFPLSLKPAELFGN